MHTHTQIPIVPLQRPSLPFRDQETKVRERRKFLEGSHLPPGYLEGEIGAEETGLGRGGDRVPGSPWGMRDQEGEKPLERTDENHARTEVLALSTTLVPPNASHPA